MLIPQVGGFVYILEPCGSLQWTLLWGWKFLPLPQPPQIFFSQRFWGFSFPCWNHGLCSLLLPQLFLLTYLNANVGYPHLPAATSPTLSASRCLGICVLHLGFLFPPLLPVWMNVSSFTPLLSDLHTVQFSGSSGCFLFLNWLLSFFWLYEEAVCPPMLLSWRDQNMYNFDSFALDGYCYVGC